MRFLRLLLSLVVLGLIATVVAAKDEPSPGVIAASVAEVVALADPVTGQVKTFEAGTVGWLYEGPAGLLFAPDLIAGKTTVFNLRAVAVADRIDGVTVPHFGPKLPDRYIVVAGDVLMVSYPDRAVIGTVEAEIDYPWQVVMISDSVLLALEKGPLGEGPTYLTAVDMVSRQIVYRRKLPDSVGRIGLSREFGLLVYTDAASDVVRLVDPATLSQVLTLATAGPVNDAVFLDSIKMLAAVSPSGNGGGELRLWKLKAKKGDLSVKKEESAAFDRVPLRIAHSPAEDQVAVTFEGGRIDVISLHSLEVVRTFELSGTPRDVVWCDPSRPGPMAPEWSSDSPPELRMDP